MPNKHEKEIPQDAAGKLIAEYLRLLRRAVGSPSYRKLEQIAGVKQNALSQHASGVRVILPESVKLYVATVLRYASQHGIDLAAEMRPHAAAFEVDPDDDILTQALAIRERNYELTRKRTAPRSDSAGDTADDPATPDRSRAAAPDASIPGPAVPEAVANAKSLPEVVSALNDLIMTLGWNLSARTWDVHRVGVPTYLMEREALDSLTGRLPLTDRVYAQILHACGAGVFEDQTFHPHHKAWTLAWQRATAVQEQAEEPAADAEAGIPMTEEVKPERGTRWLARLRALASWRWMRRRWERPDGVDSMTRPPAPAQRADTHDRAAVDAQREHDDG
ncbi:hypothetical protein AB0J72_46820 [Dactylosporangium sp. NPDC049742]|uniref:hypothetical protein n=1 Tax=Dactylosporangium sp. NPDC049742 TaxID=3154737 RepID=UPI0034223B43